ncbi:hypothetical protein C8R47DRAFT_1283000 [Mycena vitilis]|nr:hypothetical protein C8R47DRAFT_1283000 [Mycena vitilis]
MFLLSQRKCCGNAPRFGAQPCCACTLVPAHRLRAPTPLSASRVRRVLSLLQDVTQCKPTLVSLSLLLCASYCVNVDPGRVYTADDLKPGTYDAAKVSPNPRFVDGVSKALAERAFWDYIKEQQPAWAGATILPSSVFDPAIQPLRSLADLNRSIAFPWDVASGKHKAGLALSIAHRNYVSVRDVALAHVRAAERDEAKGQRYLLTAGSFSVAQLLDVIARNIPDLAPNLPASPAEEARPMVFDTAEMRVELGRGFEEVIVDTIRGVLELRERFGSE